jgi:hypothetical protein
MLQHPNQQISQRTSQRTDRGKSSDAKLTEERRDNVKAPWSLIISSLLCVIATSLPVLDYLLT